MEGSEASLSPVNKQLKTASVIVKSQNKTEGFKDVIDENNGILLLFLIAIFIAALLFYINFKKRRI